MSQITSSFDKRGNDGVVEEAIRLREAVLADLDWYELLDQRA